MSKARSSARSNPLRMAKELFTAATLPALSNALINRGIDPHAILAIEMPQPTSARAARPQFRVLYEDR
jgi:hypothetical protein